MTFLKSKAHPVASSVTTTNTTTLPLIQQKSDYNSSTVNNNNNEPTNNTSIYATNPNMSNTFPITVPMGATLPSFKPILTKSMSLKSKSMTSVHHQQPQEQNKDPMMSITINPNFLNQQTPKGSASKLNVLCTSAYKQRKKTRQNIILNAVQENQYDAMIKLTNEIAEKDRKIKELEDEIKTMKILNFRQEKALSNLSKDQLETPILVNNLQEDIKILKTERKKLSEKIILMEKNAKSRVDELVKLQHQNERLKRQIDMNEIDAKDEALRKFQQLQIDNEQLTRKVNEQDKLFKHALKEKGMEIKEWKQRYYICHQELEGLRELHDFTVKKLEDKEKQLTNAEIQLQIKRTKDEQKPHIRLERPQTYCRKGVKTSDTQTSQGLIVGEARHTFFKPNLTTQKSVKYKEDAVIHQFVDINDIHPKEDPDAVYHDLYVPQFGKDYFLPSYERAYTREKYEEESILDNS